MKARLPKMLLAALLAAVSTAYADHKIVDTGDQYYWGTETVTNPAEFGSGVSAAPESTVNIGYGDQGGPAHEAHFTLSGTTFTTPNALFIGGPGWPHTVTEGYAPSTGYLTLDNGAVLEVGVLNPGNPSATHITMGSCVGAESHLNVQGGSKIKAGSLDASIGGGYAFVDVGSEASGAGFVDLSGDLKVGMNRVAGASGWGEVDVYSGSRVNVAGVTAVGAAASTGEYTLGGEGYVNVMQNAELNTGSLEIGVGVDGDGVGSYGHVTVGGMLNVTDNKNAILIGINGGFGKMYVEQDGTADLDKADIIMGSTKSATDETRGEIRVFKGGSINHRGTIYVGYKGTVDERDGNPYYGVGELDIQDGAIANLHNVDVSADSTLIVDGKVTANEQPWGEYTNAPGAHLFTGSYVGGAPDPGSKITLVSVKLLGEETADIHMAGDGLTLTEGTTFEACCDTHMKVGEGTALNFGPGLMHLTEGVLYIDAAGRGDVGSIGTIGTGIHDEKGNYDVAGYVSIADNASLQKLLPHLIRRDVTSRMALIDASDLINSEGSSYGDFISGDKKLKLTDNNAYEIRFTEDGVTVINDGYAPDAFQGFYIVKTGNPAEDGYYQLDRNETTVYDVIDRLDREGAQIPEDLKRAIDAVLNIDGKKNLQELRQALDFLGTVNYSVMMHNQIDGNTSHQRMLRNRSMVGRNLRHRKGCTDVYAAAFFDTQRNNYGFHSGEGYHRTEWGGLVGADTCVNQYLRIGGDVAFGRARINPAQNWSMHQNSIYWDVYAQLRKGNWRSITALGMGIHSFDLKRGFGGLTAKANNVKGYSLNITEEVSYDWKVNGKTTIQPFAALDLNWNTIKSFTDGDVGSMNMHVKRQRALAADLTVGGRYIRDFALLRNVPDATWYFQAGVTVSMGKTDCDMDCNFVGAPNAPFTIYAAKRDRVGLNLGAGITIPVTDRWAVFANGEAILRGDSHNINAQIGVQVAF